MKKHTETKIVQELSRFIHENDTELREMSFVMGFMTSTILHNDIETIDEIKESMASTSYHRILDVIKGVLDKPDSYD